MTNQSLTMRAGTESYLETVSAELRGLGHDVCFFSPCCGELAERIRADGFDVFESVAELPEVDVIHGQHADAIALVRSRFDSTPLVFVTHSWVISLEDPLPELGAAAYVALNELTHRRLAAHVATEGAEIVRLTQPVSTSYADTARAPLATDLVRAVAVSRHMSTVVERLGEACAEAGIALTRVGGTAGDSADARAEMRAADIVFGVGRTALEAMAAGRATFVVDQGSLGGWVTPASHSALEADGFTGRLVELESEDLGELLAAYHPGLGIDARRLALRHHSVRQHATALVDLYRRVAGTGRVATASPSLARVTRERFVWEARAVKAEWHTAELRRALEQLRSDLDATVEQRDRFRSQRDQFRRQRNRLRQLLSRQDQPSGGWLARLRRR